MFKVVEQEPAILLETADHGRVMVVAELHIGVEKRFLHSTVASGAVAKSLLRRILSLVKKNRVSYLLVVGDVKDEIFKPVGEEADLIVDFFSKLKKAVGRVLVVPGNHDGDLAYVLPDGVDMAPSRGVVFELRGYGERIGVLHGHTWPDAELLGAKYLLMAHLHPSYSFRDRFNRRIVMPIWVEINVRSRRGMAQSYLEYFVGKRFKNPVRKFKEVYGFPIRTRKIIIMPPFNKLLTGLALNESERVFSTSPILRSLDPSSIEVNAYLTDLTYLGKLDLNAPQQLY